MEAIALVKIQQVRLVVCIHNEVSAARLVVGRGKPRHYKINNLRAEMQAFVLDINAKLGKQDGWVIDKSLLMVNLKPNFLLSGVGQLLGEDAGVGHSEACHNVGRAVGQTEIIGLAKQFVLIVLRFIMEEIVDGLSAAVESLYVQARSALWHKLQVVDFHHCKMGERAINSL